jgi:hypothetical protein
MIPAEHVLQLLHWAVIAFVAVIAFIIYYISRSPR